MLGLVRQSLGRGTVIFPFLWQAVERAGLATSTTEKNYLTVVKELKVHDALNSALDEEMAIDPKVLIMGEKVGGYQGAYKISRGLLQKYGSIRVLDNLITKDSFDAEFMRIAMGMTCFGLRPVVEFKTYDFSWQAIYQIIDSAVESNFTSDGQLSLPIIFKGPNGADVGVGFQQSQCYVAEYALFNFVKVLAPYSSEDARGLLKAAIRDPTPVVFLENEFLYEESFPVSEAALDSNFCIPIGKAKIEREGNNVTITSFSKMVGYALQAAEILSRDGISAEVINLRSIQPLDRDAITASVKKTKRLITVEEGFLKYSVGARTSDVVFDECFKYLDAPVEEINGANIPRAVLQVEDIVQAAKRACYR